MKLLPENPTQFDYLHAIRAVASREGLKQIFDLADAGMMAAEPSKTTMKVKVTAIFDLVFDSEGEGGAKTRVTFALPDYPGDHKIANTVKQLAIDEVERTCRELTERKVFADHPKEPAPARNALSQLRDDQDGIRAVRMRKLWQAAEGRNAAAPCPFCGLAGVKVTHDDNGCVVGCKECGTLAMPFLGPATDPNLEDG